MISVIIPVYNQAEKLADCLKSLAKQTYKNFEIIIINDGSKDNPSKIVEEFSSQNKNEFNILYLTQENKGAPSARNKGWRASKGEYLFFCDADSILHPDCFEILLNTLANHPELSYAYSSLHWGMKYFKVGEFSPERLKAGPYIHTMSLIRRECFPANGWDESIKKFQDWDLYLTMYNNQKKGIWVDKTLFKIQTGGTISSWLPTFAYKLFPFLPQVKQYYNAMQIIREKHKL